jgi:hypothetical protein
VNDEGLSTSFIAGPVHVLVYDASPREILDALSVLKLMLEAFERQQQEVSNAPRQG